MLERWHLHGNTTLSSPPPLPSADRCGGPGRRVYRLRKPFLALRVPCARQRVVGMPLKVVVELQIHAVSCPGVYLTEKSDVYLHVCILGQCKETDCLRPIFPLLFHEKMWFEKVFENATDPIAVVELLEKNVTRFRLSELVPSEREDIAFYEDNTRDFLFPEPKLTPTYPGVDRELLMNTHPSFPGIAPKLEFSTRTTITELPLLSRRWYRVDPSKMFEKQVPYRIPSHNVSPSRNSHKLQLKRALSFDSWKAACPAAKVIREPDEQYSSDHDPSSLETREPANYSPAFCHKASFPSPTHYRSPSPGGRWASPQHRIYSSPNSSWEEINERVKNLLTSDEAKQRLSIGATDFEIDDVLERRSISLRSFPQCDSME
ncbi:spermatogenesis associated 6-like protein isoform X4 [Rhineura floridana]|uniref:spermatogenesis associated 6-like protein isoform X4 n=1 Tax=Rhineura floridana TaxID=261503 RepID=UPI002AC86C28|nr:spermatogenesis associated 6-like protein isoform X4 [Rhineura floridana]